MIITEYPEFCKIVRETLAELLPKPESHKKDATFEIGDDMRGFHLRVDEHGWWRKINGVKSCGQYRLASPLSNFQASVLTIA